MNSISFAEAEDDLEAVLERVATDRAPVAVRRDGAEDVVLVAESDWLAMQAEVQQLAQPRR